MHLFGAYGGYIKEKGNDMGNPIARQLHDAKRVYVYEYACDGKTFDGKITINKRLLTNTEIDYVDAVENRDVEIINCSKGSTFSLGAVEVDEAALKLMSKILFAYEQTGQMPFAVE